MSGFSEAFLAEYLKVRRSRMLWLSVGVALFMAVMIGFMMYIANNPGLSARMGLMAAKSSILEDATWPGYLGLMVEMISAMGAVLFGFIASWVFGREYSDRTVKDLLALPMPRRNIVFAKFAVIAIWSAVFAVVLLAGAMATGFLVGLPGWSSEVAYSSVYAYLAASLMTILLVTPVGLLASYSRGYLAPIAFVIAVMIIGQFVVVLNLGPYFPWAVPALYGIAVTSGSAMPGAVSYVLLILTCLAGLAATLAWWRYADQF
jgi:ABC-2 type transport system permease protein